MEQQVSQQKPGSRVVRYGLRGIAVLFALLLVATCIGTAWNARARHNALAVAGIPGKLFCDGSLGVRTLELRLEECIRPPNPLLEAHLCSPAKGMDSAHVQ